ncbi:hypothetical protein MRX96_041165 [Rhipicephalus microplus]
MPCLSGGTESGLRPCATRGKLCLLSQSGLRPCATRGKLCLLSPKSESADYAARQCLQRAIDGTSRASLELSSREPRAPAVRRIISRVGAARSRGDTAQRPLSRRLRQRPSERAPTAKLEPARRVRLRKVLPFCLSGDPAKRVPVHRRRRGESRSAQGEMARRKRRPVTLSAPSHGGGAASASGPLTQRDLAPHGYGRRPHGGGTQIRPRPALSFCSSLLLVFPREEAWCLASPQQVLTEATSSWGPAAAAHPLVRR